MIARQSLATGPGKVIVKPAFGGFLLGWDVDAAGTEGLLSEYVDYKSSVLAATETFDLKTGAILKVLRKVVVPYSKIDQYSTWGVFGHIGLDEHYLTSGQKFPTLNPLDGNQFTRYWTPSRPDGDFLSGISSDARSSENVAVLEFESGGNANPIVFSSSIAENTFGPHITVTDPVFCQCLSPVFAYDGIANEAVLASSYQESNSTTQIAMVNLKTKAVTEFTAGLGSGGVLGLAVDSRNGVAVTTSYYDNGVEFYNLKKHTGFEVTLPCSGGTFGAAQDVAFDPIHTLFLVADLDGNSCDSFGRIYVYDEHGNVQKLVTGFAIGPVEGPIALHPVDRTGFAFQNRDLRALQSFNY